jgi:hypothetical protein
MSDVCSTCHGLGVYRPDGGEKVACPFCERGCAEADRRARIMQSVANYNQRQPVGDPLQRRHRP